MPIAGAADTLLKTRRRDLSMVAVVVLFPLMLLQFGLNVLILRSAATSEIVSLALPQIVVLVLTAVLLVAGVWLVMAACLPLVRAVETGEEVTADDALKALPHSLRSVPAKADGAVALNLPRLLGPLVLGYVAVMALMVLVTGNLLTIGMAFLEMTGLLAVGVLLTPPVAVRLLVARLGVRHSDEPEVEAPAVPVADVPSTSVPPPGATPVPAPGPASSVPPGGRPSVPPPPS